MKTKNLLWLFISLFLLTAPTVQTLAFGDEVEITLLEVSGFLPGNDPLGNPMQEGDTPPRPNDFSAAITGSTLTITSGTHSAQLIVFLVHHRFGKEGKIERGAEKQTCQDA